jgi:hypothetical protein
MTSASITSLAATLQVRENGRVTEPYRRQAENRIEAYPDLRQIVKNLGRDRGSSHSLSLDPPKPFQVYRCFSRSGP